MANCAMVYQQSGEISSRELAKNVSIVPVGTRDAKTVQLLIALLSAYYSIRPYYVDVTGQKVQKIATVR